MKKNIESGRSMTEMLGILAIIAVLTITAIVGYRYAIDKYHTNETLQEITRRRIVLDGQYNQYKEMNQDEFGTTTTQGYPVTFDLLPEEQGGFYIELSDVPNGVCKQILKSDYSVLITVDGGNTCGELNKIRFTFAGVGEWCVRIDDKGNCCDNTGRCCPKDKPLLRSDGVCVSCEFSQTIALGPNTYMCDRCDNRILVGGTDYCTKKCPMGQYRDINGNCHACDDLVHGVPLDTNHPNNLENVLSCPQILVSKNGNLHAAYHCDTSYPSVPVVGYPETCAKCPNRTLVRMRDLCAKACPTDQYRDNNGNCHRCDEISDASIEYTPENIALVLGCPKVMLADSGTSAYVSHCDSSDLPFYAQKHPETCAKCPDRDLVNGSEWCAKACPEAQFRSYRGYCLDCSLTQEWLDKTPANIAKAMECPDLITNGYGIYSCNSSIQAIPVAGYTQTCAKCSNRTLVGNNCVIK